MCAATPLGQCHRYQSIFIYEKWGEWIRGANRQTRTFPANAAGMLKWVSGRLSRHHSTTASCILPIEVLELIIRHCSHAALFRCCRVNRTLYSIAIVRLYEDPFALDYADYRMGWPFEKRTPALSKTLVNNHLAELARALHSQFWEYITTPSSVIHVVPHLKNLVTVFLYGGPYLITALRILAAIGDHCTNVRHIKIDVFDSSDGGENYDPEMTRVLGAFPHLQDIDIAAYRDLDAESPPSMVQTIAKSCHELYSVNWRARGYYTEGALGSTPPGHCIDQYVLIIDMWKQSEPLLWNGVFNHTVFIFRMPSTFLADFKVLILVT
ncbi:hypothetical protein FRB93_000555 [Tulasnella sp. JGI-2019a]|nr:hypothetical protein FRB93_000555 [Tulasnella sp. JGI-2019a]